MGIPLLGDVTFDERFALAADGSRLNYALAITSPATLTELVTIASYCLIDLSHSFRQ